MIGKFLNHAVLRNIVMMLFVLSAAIIQLIPVMMMMFIGMMTAIIERI